MYYTVMPGDTMYMIAAQFGVSLDDLLNANPDIANPDLIYPGQVILIPVFPGMPEFPGFPGYPSEGMMPGCPPGGMMPVFPPGEMMPQMTGQMGDGMAFTLKIGNKGNQVKYLQKRLKELGYYNGSVSGHFGPKTKNAVKKFQKDCQVAANGIADQSLLQALG